MARWYDLPFCLHSVVQIYVCHFLLASIKCTFLRSDNKYERSMYLLYADIYQPSDFAIANTRWTNKKIWIYLFATYRWLENNGKIVATISGYCIDIRLLPNSGSVIPHQHTCRHQIIDQLYTNKSWILLREQKCSNTIGCTSRVSIVSRIFVFFTNHCLDPLKAPNQVCTRSSSPSCGVTRAQRFVVEKGMRRIKGK